MSANASIEAVPGQPGRYINLATGEPFDLVEFYEGEKFDTEAVTSTIAVGSKLNYFQNLTNKNGIDSNFDHEHKLSAGEAMSVKYVAVDIPLARGNNLIRPSNIKKLLYAGYLEVKLNKSVIAEGPLYMFPSGHGLYGSTTENNTGVVSNGLPSAAAIKELPRPHYVTDEHSITGKILFEDRAWDTNTTSLAAASLVFDGTESAHVKLALGGEIGQTATK